MTYDISYYNQDITNYIVSTGQTAGDPEAGYRNADKVNIEGVESVFEYQPTDWLRLGVTHTFANNIYEDYSTYVEDKKTGVVSFIDYRGEEMRRSPQHHINRRVAVMPIEGLAIVASHGKRSEGW